MTDGVLSKNRPFLDQLSVFFATAFTLSTLPERASQSLKKTKMGAKMVRSSWTGAGLVGSIFGGLTYLLLPSDLAGHLLSLVLGIFFAVLISDRAEKVLGVHDDSRIVIDEWIGMWIASCGLRQQVNAPFLCAFVLFRLFDVFKGPWGNSLQKLPGGWGVTMDDVMAGILANGLTRLLFHWIG